MSANQLITFLQTSNTPSNMISSLETFPLFIFTLLLLNPFPVFSLTSDGSFLLSLKYSILSDPLSVLDTWDYLDQTPCSWNGVVCDPDLRVTTLSLPHSKLLGSIPPDLGLLQHLQHLDLSSNSFNGTLPSTLFNASQLQNLSLSSNVLSGDIPVFSNSSLTLLNLSDNAFGGPLPLNFTSGFLNLTVLSLKGNYFSGNVPSGFPPSLQVLDLSSNLFNGSLPSDLGVGSNLKYLNLSYNQITGEIPEEFAGRVTENATVDVSYNNLTGKIPGSKPFMDQNPDSLNGNQELCGKPLKNLCVIPSTLSNPPNASSISPAIAVIPKSVDSNSGSNSSGGAPGGGAHNSGLKPGSIVGITVADLAGVGILAVVFFYLYQLRKKKLQPQPSVQKDNHISSSSSNLPPGKKASNLGDDHFLVQINSASTTNTVEGANHKTTHKKCFPYCIKGRESEDGATSEATRTSSSDSESGVSEDEDDQKRRDNSGGSGSCSGGGSLVMVDGETELEAETLLKASAYILGASGSSIVYKAVLQDGSAFAVRRLGEIAGEKLRDFEGHIKAIAKVRHPNLVRVRGFYWASDEKLVIYDYISNGSLATSAYKKGGSTPYHLPLEARLRIARGVARGLTYIHEKRYVHANIKTSNILLNQDMEPIISDLGLSWLVYGKGSGSARQFGSKRSMGSYDGTAQELLVSGSPYISPFGNTNGVGSPYVAPESLKNLKPSPKWDVYSFGIVLLELLTGKVYLDKELGHWTPSYGLEDRYWVLRIADVALRAEIQGKEEAMMGIFKLGFSCASLVPQKRPTMKEALQVLEKISLSFVH